MIHASMIIEAHAITQIGQMPGNARIIKEDEEEPPSFNTRP